MAEPAHATSTLVAIHGNFASSAWWAELQRHPPSGWTVLAPTLPGFAGTPLTTDVSITAYADWLLDWIDAAGAPTPVLLGHSLGGAVALDAASRHPTRVRALILAASAPLGGLVTPQENYPVLELLRSSPTLLEQSLAALFPSRWPANFAALVQDAAHMHPAQYSGNARTLSTWRVDPETLSPMPVLVTGGDLDQLIAPDMIRAQADALHTTSVILPGRGHGFPHEDPAAFLATIEPFLHALPPAPGAGHYTEQHTQEEP